MMTRKVLVSAVAACVLVALMVGVSMAIPVVPAYPLSPLPAYGESNLVQTDGTISRVFADWIVWAPTTWEAKVDGSWAGTPTSGEYLYLYQLENLADGNLEVYTVNIPAFSVSAAGWINAMIWIIPLGGITTWWGKMRMLLLWKMSMLLILTI